jgi:hypothetical protein
MAIGEPMDKPRIFLGSSGKQAKLLQALTRGLENVAPSLALFIFSAVFATIALGEIPMANRVKSTTMEPSTETIEIHHTIRCRGLPAPLLLLPFPRPPIVLRDRAIKYVPEFGDVLQEAGVKLQTVGILLPQYERLH